VQQRFDRLLGAQRQEYIKELAREGKLEISDAHWDVNRRMGLSLIVVGAVAASRLYNPLFLVSAPLYAVTLIPRCQNAYKDLTTKRRITLAVLLAVFGIGVMLTGNFLVGALAFAAHSLILKLELSLQERAGGEVANVFGSQSRTVTLLGDGVETEVSFTQVKAGDLVLVHAGQAVPVDGYIRQGMGMVDQHRLTGESQPVERERGQEVFAATVLLTGRLVVEVRRAGEETLAAEMTRILGQTTNHHLEIESSGKLLAERTMTPTFFGALLIIPFLGAEPAVALLGAAMPGIDLLFAGPVALLNFLNYAASRQILIKDARSLESMWDVDGVVFDKTGTLTLEQPHVAAIHLANGFSEAVVLGYAAAAERRQSHPIALAILSAAEERRLEILDIDEVKYSVGHGIEVRIPVIKKPIPIHGTGTRRSGDSNGDIRVTVGSERFLTLEGIDLPDELFAIRAVCESAGNSVVFVAIDGGVAGAIELAPTLRPEAKRVVDELHRRKISVRIISGDREGPTRRLAEQLGVDQYHANVLPQGKANLVAQLQQGGESLCFVGDGINDAVALKAARVSVSLRGATTAATDAAQIVFMDQSLQHLPLLFDLARDMKRNLRTSFAISAGGSYALMAGVFLLHLSVGTVLFWQYLILGVILGNTVRSSPKGRPNKTLELTQRSVADAEPWRYQSTGVSGERPIPLISRAGVAAAVEG
jgi:Cu2+-exporting ATPase